MNRQKDRTSLLSGKKVNLLGHEWFFGKDLPAIPLDAISVRRECYAIILDALQDGELWRIRKCPNCSKVFAAEHGNQKHCTESCTNSSDKERAKHRVKKSRLAGKEKKEQQYRAAEEARKTQRQRKQFENFCAFMRLASKVNPHDGELDKIKPILKHIGNGNIQACRKVVARLEET